MRVSDTSTPHAATGRVHPSVGIAFWVFLAYVLVVNGIQLASGVPYSAFFASAGNAYKSALASLAAGSLLLLAFVSWARWDGIWRDPGRLTMTRLMWVAPVVFVVLLMARLVLKLADGVPVDLLLAIVLAGVGVGLAEELLFRGIVLRSLRTSGRAEAWAMLWCSLWFGSMHLTNALIGSPLPIVLLQVVMAALSGMTLYQFRRATGSIVAGMVAHGLWDISTFLPTQSSNMVLASVEGAGLVLAPIVALVSGMAVIRHDRRTTMGAAGPVAAPGPACS